MEAKSPVLPSRSDTTASEKVIGLSQDKYSNLPALFFLLPKGHEFAGMLMVVSRFELTDEEVAEVVRMRSIWHSQLMLPGEKFAPTLLQVTEPEVG